jgi:4-diphosphocytidyl-2-C-methyl-D-erythritol kinase
LEKLSLESPAKINLFLDILRKREDGYHQIVSLMQAVDLCDELDLERRGGGITIQCDDPACPSDESNLAFKAAQLLLREARSNDGVGVLIKKKIPIAAGLGGGSSNAAAALWGINRLFGFNLSDAKLCTLASRIGSDVPFFLHAGQALVTGRGEEIKPKSIFKDYWLVLVCPNFKVSTQWAYQNFKISLTKVGKGINLDDLENRYRFFEALPHFANDLEAVVSARYPVIQRIKEVLVSSGAVKSSMSGSGPTVYGVFEQEPEAEEVAESFSRSEQDWRVFLTRPIRDQLLGRCR